MRKYFPVTFATVFVGLLLPAIVSAQSANKSAATQTRRVKGRVLTSTSLPPIRIKFDKAFKYVGTQSFILYDRAQVQQHFFVSADKQQRIKRMVIIYLTHGLNSAK